MEKTEHDHRDAEKNEDALPEPAEKVGEHTYPPLTLPSPRRGEGKRRRRVIPSPPRGGEGRVRGCIEGRARTRSRSGVSTRRRAASTSTDCSRRRYPSA